MSFLQNTPKSASIKKIDSGRVQDDLKSIKQSSADLARHIKEDAVHIAESVVAEGQHKLSDLKSFAGSYLKVLEKEVMAKPVQSMAIAVGAGAILSLLLRRR